MINIKLYKDGVEVSTANFTPTDTLSLRAMTSGNSLIEVEHSVNDSQNVEIEKLKVPCDKVEMFMSGELVHTLNGGVEYSSTLRIKKSGAFKSTMLFTSEV